MNKNYVYIYLDPRKPGKFKYDDYEFDFEPFYIGEGTGKRYLDHVKNYDNKNIIKLNKLNKIRNIGLSPIILKLHENISKEESLLIETNLIIKIGRIIDNSGPLVNVNIFGYDSTGYKHTKETLELLSKKVIKYDLDGNCLKKYNSMTEAAKDNNLLISNISNNCSGKTKIVNKNFIFKYENDQFIKPIQYENVNRYQVVRIDFNGNKIIYSSIEEASKLNNNLKHISEVCYGIAYSSGEFLWRFISHPNLTDINNNINNNYGKYLFYKDNILCYREMTHSFKHTEEYKESKKKKVIMYDLNGNILNYFNSINDAAEKTSLNRSSIGSNCNNKISIVSKKYIFKFEKEPFVHS